MVPAMNIVAIREDWVGRTVEGRFTLLQWLGGSEESGVYLTELAGEGSQKAAIKLIAAEGEEATYRLEGWAATSALRHPHLMALFDTGQCTIDGAELLYAVTEYADEDLSQVLPERALTAAETGDMLGPVLDALSFLHGNGFLHGRLKPRNILVVGEQVKLSSDNLLAAGKPRKDQPALSVYDAPERANGVVSEAGDVWSLGVTLVEALTQHPPVWDRETQYDPVVPKSIPAPFAGIARECLRAEPARRCTLADIRARLNPVPAEGEALPAATKPTAAPVKPAPESNVEIESAAPGGMRRMVLGIAVFVLIAVVVLLEVRSYKSANSTPSAEQGSAHATNAAPPQSPGRAVSASGADKGDVAERVMPEVLPSALATIHGQLKVRVRVAVDASGNVSSATLDAAGPSRYFAKVAMEAAQRWRFKPAQVDGRAVASVWMLKFQFRHDGTVVTPVETSP